MDIFWGHHKVRLYLGAFLCILGSFLKVKVQNRGYFFGSLKFQILMGCLEILIFFGSTVDAGPGPTYEEK